MVDGSEQASVACPFWEDGDDRVPQQQCHLEEELEMQIHVQYLCGKKACQRGHCSSSKYCMCMECCTLSLSHYSEYCTMFSGKYAKGVPSIQNKKYVLTSAN